MPWRLFSVKRKSTVGLGRLIAPIEWCNRDFIMKNVIKELSALASPLGDENRSLGFFCKSYIQLPCLSRGALTLLTTAYVFQIPSSAKSQVLCLMYRTVLPMPVLRREQWIAS
jgi:hypothetical protein